MRLIGRRRELAAVERLLDRLAAGRGDRLLVTGPPESGKSSLLEAAAALARDRGCAVVRVEGASLAGASEPPAIPALAALASAPPTASGLLIVIDDIDDSGSGADAFLGPAALDPAAGQAMAVLASARRAIGTVPELCLRGLTRTQLTELLPELTADAVHALWLVSGGVPGVALRLADGLAFPDDDSGGDIQDPVIRLALTTPSRAAFLDLDIGLLRLLETAVARPARPAVQARLRARLGRELLGDSSPAAARRRRDLLAEAEALASAADDPGVLAEVLDSRLHALWDPAAADERLATAGRIVECARLAGDAAAEQRGLFWRFTALAELGELESAQSALTAYARAAELAGDAEAAVIVAARQAMLATIRGRFAEAAELTGEVAARGRALGLADIDRLLGTLRGSVDALRGQYAAHIEPWLTLSRRLPGHAFEANAARALAECGRQAEARLLLDGVLPAVLGRAGPRWLAVVADSAVVVDLAFGADPAARRTAAQALYEALIPYEGRLVVWGGVNAISGPVDEYLGRLAACLGDPARALAHLDAAAALERRLGTLPWLAHTLAVRARVRQPGAEADADRALARKIAVNLGLTGLIGSLDALAPEAAEGGRNPADADSSPDTGQHTERTASCAPGAWQLRPEPDGEGWRLVAGSESVRLPAGRGPGYLRALLAAPGQEIAALDLVAGGAGLRAPEPVPVLDDTARAAFRRRLARLDGQLDAADQAGDAERAAAVHAERTALLAELRRASGLGGRPRALPAEAERARVNATRTLWATVARIERSAPFAGAHLRASLRTGRYLRYQPAPGGPSSWRL